MPRPLHGPRFPKWVPIILAVMVLAVVGLAAWFYTAPEAGPTRSVLIIVVAVLLIHLIVGTAWTYRQSRQKRQYREAYERGRERIAWTN